MDYLGDLNDFESPYVYGSAEHDAVIELWTQWVNSYYTPHTLVNTNPIIKALMVEVFADHGHDMQKLPTLIGQNQLYRGISESLRDIDNVYTSWTTSLRVAKSFAGPNGYILTINLDEIPLAEQNRTVIVDKFLSAEDEIIVNANFDIRCYAKLNKVHRLD